MSCSTVSSSTSVSSNTIYTNGPQFTSPPWPLLWPPDSHIPLWLTLLGSFTGVLVRDPQRNGAQEDVYRQRKTFILRNWPMCLGRLGSPKSAGWDDRRSRCWNFSPKAIRYGISSCLVGRSRSFVLFRLSVDWLRPTHIVEGNLLYSKGTGLHVNLIQKQSHRNIQKMFDHISTQRDPAMTHKINHRKIFFQLNMSSKVLPHQAPLQHEWYFIHSTDETKT